MCQNLIKIKKSEFLFFKNHEFSPTTSINHTALTSSSISYTQWQTPTWFPSTFRCKSHVLSSWSTLKSQRIGKWLTKCHVRGMPGGACVISQVAVVSTQQDSTVATTCTCVITLDRHYPSYTKRHETQYDDELLWNGCWKWYVAEWCCRQNTIQPTWWMLSYPFSSI